MIAIILLFNYFDLVSRPLNNHTAYYNPAGLTSLSAYEILVGPNEIGQVNFYSFTARLGRNSIGFSGSRTPYASKNWFSLARRLPLSLAGACNLGLKDEHGQSKFSTDLALLSSPFAGRLLLLPDARIIFGLVGYDLLSGDHRAVRAGASYHYRFLKAAVELEDSLQTGHFLPYAGVSARAERKDLAAEIGLGLDNRHLAGGLNFNIYNFGIGVTYIDRPQDAIKFYISLVFKERTVEKIVVKERIVEKIKEVVVEKPIYIDRVVEKPSGKKYTKLTLKQKRFCETHYQLGIKYYTEGNLKEAIAEWEKVYVIAPDYENVEINLINTKEKLKKIENGGGNQ